MQKPLYLNTDESLDGDLDVGGAATTYGKLAKARTRETLIPYKN